MKKRNLLLIPVLATLLAGCGKIDFINLSFEDGKSITQEFKKGALGDFSLSAPADNAIVSAAPTFSWTESENAMSYTLEVCSSTSFDNTSSSIVYICETNIKSTSFKVTGTLKNKKITYYWRVTAVNEYNSKSVGKEKLSEVRSFYYNVESSGEIPIEVGEQGDWQLHKVGSYADISIDHNDFFGTGDQDSLKITFEKENTSEGPITSVGWLDVQKAVERDFYGTDAFYCNFYYMGHDSTILIRVIDQDGELWYKQVQFTQDVRQVAILKFDDFILRTRDTIVQNETFNYEHIQAIEVCFEQTFGDGCCIIGGMKAVNFENYTNLFISKLDFNIVPLANWKDDTYKFKKTIIEEDGVGTGLKLEYSATADYGNEKGMGSYTYGFAKMPLERYFATGNAIRFKVKFTGHIGTTQIVFRIYEPDKDYWTFVYPYSKLIADEYKEFTIPFMAFGKGEFEGAISEGKRQFYYISQLQFGLNKCYGGGSLTYKDFEIITLPDVSKNPKVVGNDGIIENFEGYDHRINLYEKWETSSSNKDEGIFLETEKKFNDGENITAGRFTYKADMAMATYDIYTNVQVTGLNAIKFWIKDSSVPDTKSPFGGYKGKDVAANVVIQVALKDGRWYRYEIEKAPRVWTEYVIPFTSFKLYSGNPYATDPLESQNVVNFAFGLSYKYMWNGAAHPTYSMDNPVYMDNIMFASSENLAINALETELAPGADGKTLLDNFEYENDAMLHRRWLGLSDLEYENYTLSDDVSSEGGEHSMKLNFKDTNSPSYAHYPVVGDTVEATGISLDIKGDPRATIYINFYIRIGSTLHQYRCTLTGTSSTWKRYDLGIGDLNFVKKTTNAPALNSISLQNLERFTFGVTKDNDLDEVASIYVDNIRLDPEMDYDYYHVSSIS